MSEAALGRPATAPPVGDLLRLLSLPLLGVLGFGAGLAMGIPSNRVGLLAATIAMTMLGLAPLVLDSVRPPARRHLLFSTVSLSYLAHFAMPSFVLYLGSAGYGERGSFAPLLGLTPEDIAWGEFAGLLGYLAAIVGYTLPVGGALARRIPRMQREWSLKTTLAVALLMIPIGWSIFLAGQFGLIPKRAGTGFLGTLASATSFGLALLAICWLRYRSRIALALLCLLIPITMAFNFFTGSKGLFLMPLAMVATAHILVTRRMRIWWIAGFVVAITLLYPVSQIYRHNVWGSRRLSAVEVIANPLPIFGVMQRFVSTAEFGTYLREGLEATCTRLDGVVITSSIVRDTGKVIPFQGGWSLGYIPLAYIPRVLWPGKPLLTIGQWVTDNFGSGPMIESNTGPSWIGEFYFNFGWAGILVGMALMGAWFRMLQDYFLGPDATIPALLAGVVVLYGLAPQVLGGVIGAVNGVVYNLLPILFTYWAVSALTRPAPRLPPAV